MVKRCCCTYILVILLHDQIILANLRLSLRKGFYQWFEILMNLTNWEWNKNSKDFKSTRDRQLTKQQQQNRTDD